MKTLRPMLRMAKRLPRRTRDPRMRVLRRAARWHGGAMLRALWLLIGLQVAVIATIFWQRLQPLADRDPALAAFLHGMMTPAQFAVAAYLLVIAACVLRLHWAVSRAGFGFKVGRLVSMLAGAVHGPLVMFWRIPRAESLAGVPMDPDRRPWSFVRLLHQYQFRGRMPADGSEPPALRAGRRGRNGGLAAMAVAVALAAWPIGAGLANIPRETGKHQHLWAYERLHGRYLPEVSEARQRGDHEAALRRAEAALARNPEGRYALRSAARSSAALGRQEEARGYFLRLVAVDQLRVELMAPHEEPMRREAMWNDLRTSLRWLKDLEWQMAGGEGPAPDEPPR